jgi:hypothetical protein
MWVAQLSPGMVNWDLLTACQQDAAQGLYAAALAGFVSWLAGGYGYVRTHLPEHVRVVRASAASSDQHRRTPEVVANLYLALCLFADFAREAGALTEAGAATFKDRVWDALGAGAAAQKYVQAESDPVQRFIDLVVAALAAGKCHVAGPAGNCPAHPEPWGWRQRDDDTYEPRGDRIGWVDGSNLYLEPEASFHAAQQFGQQGGEPLTVASKTLHKRLHERNLLVQIDEHRGRLTYRRTLEHKVREVLWLPAALLGGEPETGPETGPAS